MKIQIRLHNAYDDTVMVHAMTAPSDDSCDAIENALIKLIRHSWTLHPGDTIKIVEA